MDYHCCNLVSMHSTSMGAKANLTKQLACYFAERVGETLPTYHVKHNMHGREKHTWVPSNILPSALVLQVYLRNRKVKGIQRTLQQMPRIMGSVYWVLQDMNLSRFALDRPHVSTESPHIRTFQLWTETVGHPHHTSYYSFHVTTAALDRSMQTTPSSL